MNCSGACATSFFQTLAQVLDLEASAALTKRDLLACALAGLMDKRIVDIGCGDLELTKVFSFREYVGYDLSAEALKLAQSCRPEWKFIHGSITDYPDERADVVICLDVLIRQKNKDEYLTLIKALANATTKRLIISGYEDLPSAEYISDICAYHEPLSKSLSNLEVFNEVISIGSYGGLSWMVADKNETGAALHKNDLPIGELNQIVKYVDRKDLLRLIMDSSRNWLGFYTKTSIRAIEYPWMLERVMQANPVRIADIGAGVSPLPILLGEKGCSITTIDFHSIKRELVNQSKWNEWGFLDYSEFVPSIKSYNLDVLRYRPEGKFDVIYSVSVIEHMPRKTWEQFIKWAAKWLKPGGRLILTLDLIPGSELLWNFSEGVEVEEPSKHGNLDGFRDTLRRNNLIERDFQIIRGIPFSRTDLALLDCQLNIYGLNVFRNLLDKIKAL